MIDFRKSWLGYNTLFMLEGSSIPRAVVPALVAGGMCALAEAIQPWNDNVTKGMLGSQPFQIYFWVVSFLAVFRVQHSYSRFVEARQHFQTMTSHWRLAVSLSCAFASGAPQRKLRSAFRADLMDSTSWILTYANKFFTDVRCAQSEPMSCAKAASDAKRLVHREACTRLLWP